MPEGGGIGYVLGPDIDIGAIDIDDCRDAKTGRLNDAAQSIVNRSASLYVEVTPSGEGIRIIGRVSGEEPLRKVIEEPVHLELYRKQWRYITISGRQIQGGKELTPIDWLIDELATRAETKSERKKASDKDGTKSGTFYKTCCSMFERRKTIDQVVAWFERHSDQYPERFENRLEEEVKRCFTNWDGEERPGKKKERKSKGLVIKTADTVEPRDTDWEWYPYMAREEIMWILAKGGTGKGLFCADLAARMTKGGTWPIGNQHIDKGNVMWFESEDNIETTVVPRLIGAGADLSKIMYFERDPDQFLDLKKEDIEKHQVGMIVLSPLLSYLGIDNFNKEVEVREALEAMSNKIRGLGCTIIGILHPNKKNDLAAVERILGSVAFGNFVRTLVILREEDEGIVRMVHAKHNLSSRGDDLIFTKRNTQPLKHARGQYLAIEWEKADDQIDPSTMLDEKERKTTEDDGAPQWLTKYLDDGEWHDAAEVIKDADRDHFTEGSIKKARLRNSKIELRKSGFPARAFWRLKKR